MKIAFVVTHFPALSETFVLNQITGLMDRGHEVDIYADRPAEQSTVHPEVHSYGLLARTHYAPRLPGNALARLVKGVGLAARHAVEAPDVVARALNIFTFGSQAASLKLLYRAVPFLPGRPAYDVILAHFGQNGLRALALRDLGVLRGRLATVFHGSDMSTYLRKAGAHVYDDLLARGDLFLPISHRWRQALIQMGASPEKTLVHRMGIDCGKFPFRARELQPGQPARLLSLARLVEKKGLEYAVRAAARLRHLNFCYDIVGDGPMRGDLQKLIAELGLAERVRLLGWKQQTEVLALLNEAHILVAPSVTGADGDQEGIPVAMMEAMAMGLPVVSTLHSSIPELVADGDSGYLVPERDVEALADRIGNLLQSPERWPALGAAGRRRVEAEFNLNRLHDALVERFQALAPPGRATP
jgi:colanic acid/amylovoran biosynthesis glycosyltransferase